MRLSANGRKLIQQFEGLALNAYPDPPPPPGEQPRGYSIGYGHYGAKKGDVITRQKAEELFDQDVAKYELAVSLDAPNATQDQFDAMTSLTYNIGTGGFNKSTVRARHNMGDYAGAADAFKLFNKSQGNVLAVLTNRRAKERNVYLNGHGAYQDQNVSSLQSDTTEKTAAEKGKGGVGQFFIGLLAALGIAYGAYTRTNLLQGKFEIRKGKPRALPDLRSL